MEICAVLGGTQEEVTVVPEKMNGPGQCADNSCGCTMQHIHEVHDDV